MKTTTTKKNNFLADGLAVISALAISMLVSTSLSAQTFVPVAGMPDNVVLCVKVDGSGNKWAGTKTGGLVKYDNTTITSWNTGNSSIPFNSVADLTIDPSGNIWIAGYGGLGSCNWGTGMGIAKFNGTTWTSYNTGNSTIPNDSVAVITSDNSGNVWIGLKNGTVAKYNGSTWTSYNPGAGEIRDIAAAPNGDVWVANFGGVARISSTGVVTPFYNINLGGGGFVSQAVSVVIDASGGVGMTSWMGGRRYNYNGTSWSSVAVNGLWTGCGVISVDSNGDYWMANSSNTPYGLYVQNAAGTATQNYTSFGSMNVHAIAPESGTVRWIATSNGLWKGTGSVTGIASNVADAAQLRAYPNPFTGSATISYTLESSANVSLEVVNALGQQAALLAAGEEQAAGQHQYTFGDAAPGVYFIRMTVNGQPVSSKLIKTE